MIRYGSITLLYKINLDNETAIDMIMFFDIKLESTEVTTNIEYLKNLEHFK